MEGKLSRVKRFFRRDTSLSHKSNSSLDTAGASSQRSTKSSVAPPATEQVTTDDSREGNKNAKQPISGPSTQPVDEQQSDLWRDAYAKLHEERRSLIQDYNDILTQETGNAKLSDSEMEKEKHVSAVVTKKLEEMQSKEWKIRLGEKSVKIREQIDRIVKVVQIFKDIGSAAASLDPIHAGLPWAGVCVLLSLMSNDSEQQNAAIDGLEKVTALIKQYAVIESIYFRRADATLQKESAETVTKLYYHILEYQVKAACYFALRTGYRTLRNIVRIDDWSGLLATIKSLDEECRGIMGIFDSIDYRNAMGSIEQLLEEQAPKVQETLEIVRKLLSHAEGLEKAPSQPSFMVPFYRDTDFVGRTDHIKAVDEIFVTQRRAALVGLGGVGKSQIAIEYCYRFREEHPDAHIFWVHASSKTRFEQAYHDVAKEFRLPGWDDPKSDTLQLVSSWLKDETNGFWLMVLDNADDYDVFFALDTHTTSFEGNSAPFSTYLPQSSNGSILITSRNRKAAFNLASANQNAIIDVHAMGEEDAKSLLRKKLPADKSSEEDCLDLIRELEQLPLAITQAAAYISVNAPRMTISKYLKLFRRKDENQANLLEEEIIKDPRRDPSIRSSVIKTWLLSFDQIRKDNPQASDLLSLVCILDRQRIPEFLFYDEDDSLEFEENLGVLMGFSLVAAEGDDSFGMHRLVQLATRKWLDLQHTKEEWQEKALGLLAEKFPDPEYKHWEICQTLLPHAQVAIGYTFSTEANLLRRARLLKNLAWYDKRSGRYNIAYTRCREALDLYEALLSPEHRDTLACVADLALILQDQGKYKEAEDMHRRALEGSEKVLGAEDQRTLSILSNLSLALRDQGKYDEAEQIGRRAVIGKEKALGAEDPSTLTALHNLAIVLVQAGKYEEAEKIHRQELEGSERVLGVEHPDTLASLGGLAAVLFYQGKHEEAEKMTRRSLEGRQKVLGVEHPDTLNMMNNLASMLRSQGKYEEAEKMNRRVLEGKEKVLGLKHPSTLISVMSLASVLGYQRKYKEAEEMHQRALEGIEKVMGPEHPYTLTGLSNLALMLQEQGRHQEAEEIGRRALIGKEKVLGPEHPDTITTRKNLISVLRQLGRSEEAEEIEKTGH